MIEESDISERIEWFKALGTTFRLRGTCTVEYEAVERGKPVTLQLHGTRVDIENLDQVITAYYTCIALEEYERKRLPHATPESNFVGLFGELCFREALKETLRHQRLVVKYIERERRYWDEDREQKKYDFKIIHKKREEQEEDKSKTVEIYTAAPFKNQVNCLIRESEWKRADYAVGVKILVLLCDAPIQYKGKWKWIRFDSTQPTQSHAIEMDSQPQETLKVQPIVGSALVCGYATREEIESEWERAHGEYPCPHAPCRYRRLDRLRPIEELWEKLKRQAIQ